MKADPLPASSETALADLRSRHPDIRVETRSTRRSLLGLRRDQSGRLVLRVHPALLEADCALLISTWISQRGRGAVGRTLRQVLHDVAMQRAEADARTADEWLASRQTVGKHLDDNGLHILAERVAATWFENIAKIAVRWGRQPPARRLGHLRFGCYRRSSQVIELSPRLARPWVALSFVEHVVHHEYCHHLQALSPLSRREMPHSPRFRAWERSYPRFDEALRWERLALPWLLSDAAPPWWHTQHATT